MDGSESGESPLVDRLDNAGITGDGRGQGEQTVGERHSDSNMAEKSSEEMNAVNNSIGQAFIAAQTEGRNTGSQEKSGSNEMVFTVVAVDGNLGELSFDNGNLTKEVQLSIMPTVPTDGATSATDVQFQNSQNSQLFNQLALIASAMPASPSTQQVREPGQQGSPLQNHEKKQADEPEKEDDRGKDDGKYFSDDKLDKKERVRCSVCNQDFSDLPSMRRHRLIHSDEKPFQCEFCEKSFRRKDNLREHRNIHTQENVYTCTRCGKTFPRKYTHKVHMAKFCTKEKVSTEVDGKNNDWPQTEGTSIEGGSTTPKSRASTSSHTKCSDPCAICHKTFRDTSTLKRHLLTHSDDRPYKCGVCNKSFRRKDHLMEHVIVHNEVRPFTCLQCGKSFSRKNGLKTHMIRTSHGPMQDQRPVVHAVNYAKDTGNSDVSTAVKTSSDVELVLESSQVFLRNMTNNDGNVGDALGGNPENSAAMTSRNSQNPVNSQNSGEIMETETTIVLSEKNQKTPHESDISRKDVINFPVMNTDPENSEKPDAWMSSSHDDDEISGKEGGALRCPNCPNVFPGKEALWQHFQEHLGDDLFGCEHCFTTYTTPELVEQHQKACVHAMNRNPSDGGGVEVTNENRGEVGTQSEEVFGTVGDTSSDRDGTGEHGTAQGNKKVVVRRVGEDSLAKGLRKCPVCDKNFRDSTALKRHSLVHSGERPHACDQCGKRFRRRDHLKSHVTAYHLVTTSFQCKSCQMVFSTRYCLTTHSKTCRKVPTRGQSTAVDSTKQPQPAEPKCCPICNKAFKDSSSQRRHQRTHSEERPFPCPLCTKSFRRKDNLKEHMLCHSDQKPFSCEDCGKALSRRSSLTNHRTICAMRRIESSMAITQLQYPPTPENLTLPKSIALSDNQTIETQSIIDTQSIVETEILSENQALPENQTLPDNQPLQENQPLEEDQSLVENHSDTYTEPSNETLDICTGDVTQGLTSSDMNDGETMEDIPDMGNEEGELNEGDKGFSCDLCGKAFRAKWTLKYHQRVHTGEKPYTCLTCDRQFRQPSHLKIHERTHSGERPYACDVCGRAFIDSSTMRRHARVHKDAAGPNDVIGDVTNTDQSQISMEGNIEGIEMDVSSLNANSAQPMSTAAVPGINQSDDANIVHVVRELAGDGSSQAEDIVITGKLQSLSDVSWQGNVQDNGEQMTYYILPTSKEGSEKQNSFENISF